MLIVFSGLPGTGKTTIARELATRTHAVYLRIDSIEQAIGNAGVLKSDVGVSGYAVAQALALDNLRQGKQVIVDCVNPVAESRQAWCTIAADAGVALLNVQIVCCDTDEHRRRIETRTTDIAGLTPPDWASVLAHDYQPWDEPPLTLDTARVPVQEALAIIQAHCIETSPATKACPVVLRTLDGVVHILAFKHPLAGHQLVKGSIEPLESTAQAAVRELAEESGIEGVRAVQNLGLWQSELQRQIWSFERCEVTASLPEHWSFATADDGGRVFEFFWHPLSQELPAPCHEVYQQALVQIRNRL